MMEVRLDLAAAGALAAVMVSLGVWLWARRRRRVATALADARLSRLLADEALDRVPWGRVALVLLAALSVGAALADPRWGAPAAAGDARGGTVALVLDASGSMLASDVEPSRLEQERSTARALVRALPGAAVGVVVFAGRAYAVSPPTTDAGAVELYLDALDPSIVTQSGSSLASAIRQGLGLLLGGGAGEGGALVLATDGDVLEDPEGALDAARLAARAGIPVHVVGIGTPGGGVVPEVDLRTGEVLGPRRDPAGELVTSRLNEPLLREIAEQTDGVYVRAGDERAVPRLVEALMRSGGGPGGGGLERPARYGWFAGAALLLLLAELAAGTRARRGR